MRPFTSSLQYTKFTVRTATTLLAFLEQALDGISRSRAKEILRQGFKSSSLRDAGVEDSYRSELAALLRKNISSLAGKE